jgi:hypothetical protein
MPSHACVEAGITRLELGLGVGWGWEMVGKGHQAGSRWIPVTWGQLSSPLAAGRNGTLSGVMLGLCQLLACGISRWVGSQAITLYPLNTKF